MPMTARKRQNGRRSNPWCPGAPVDYVWHASKAGRFNTKGAPFSVTRYVTGDDGVGGIRCGVASGFTISTHVFVAATQPFAQRHHLGAAGGCTHVPRQRPEPPRAQQPSAPLDFSLRRNIEEASLTLDQAGYTLATYTPHSSGQARPLWESTQPDVVLTLNTFTPEQAEAIRAAGITRLIPDPDAPSSEDYIDNGPALQLEYLAKLGHNAVAYAGLNDPKVADLVNARRARAQETATALGLRPILCRNIDLSDESALAAIDDWRSAGVAAALTGAALRAGLSVPGDLSIIGLDNTPLSSMFQPQLSTINVDTAGLGRYLGRLALSAIEGTPPPTAGREMRATLIPRASTAALQ